MDTEKVIADLRDQLEMVNQVIKIVEDLAASRGRRRGRPPKRLKETRARRAAPGERERNKASEQGEQEERTTLAAPGARA
jgi:hypothetical protein